jgi:predicted transcriptional regulator
MWGTGPLDVSDDRAQGSRSTLVGAPARRLGGDATEVARRIVARRPDGALESDVLAVLWAAPKALTPGEVRDRLAQDLAYTTVMTVLTRLVDKGVLKRAPRGRAYAYSPVLSEGELAAHRMAQALDSAADHTSALSGFVGALSARDARLLRQLIEERTSR